MQSAMQSVYEEFKFPFAPKDFQLRAFTEAIDIDSVLLWCPVGSGKTALATWVALYHSITSSVDQIMVVVPASLVTQWCEWFNGIQFSDGSRLEVLAYQGTPMVRQHMPIQSVDVIVMSHNIFRKDYPHLRSLYSASSRLIVLYDESQDGLRKPGNAIWRQFKQFTVNKRAVLISGTPISAPGDTYGVVKILDPNIYMSRRHFDMVHVGNRDFWGNVTEWKNLDEMHINLMKVAVRVTESELDELPPVIFDKVVYELGKKHMELYNKLVVEEMLKTDSGGIVDVLQTSTMFHTLQQFVTNPEKYDIKGVLSNLLNMVLTVYQEDESKLVVFGNYIATNRAVLEGLNNAGIPAVGCWGDHSNDQKNKAKKAFQHDPDIKVIVGNPGSLGVGTDGLQRVCYREVFTELPLTPPKFEQAIGRIKRTGQERPGIVRCLVAKGTIQENLYYSMLAKDDLLQKVVKNEVSIRELFGRAE